MSKQLEPLLRTTAALFGLLIAANLGCDNGGSGDPDNPCDSTTCNNPPPPVCDGDEVVVFADSGTCEDGECFYPEADRYTCDDPPPGYCEQDVEVAYSGPAECIDGECSYTETRTTCADIAHVCEPDEGGCVDPCADISCPPLDTWCEEDVLWTLVGHCDWQTTECIYEEVATDLPGCGFGYNFDFEIWSHGEPEGFVRHPTSGFRAIEEASEVNTGTRSALLETDVSEGRYIRASMPFEHVEAGQSYTFHLWYRFEGRPPGGSSAFLQPMIEVADAASQVEPEWLISGPRITAAADEWQEITVTTPPLTGDRAFLTPLLQIRGEEGEGSWAHIDDWAVTIPITRNLNSRRDLDSLLFLFNGNYWVASGIDNRGQIYPTARAADVDNGWDQMLFTWVGRPCDSLVPAPWGKSGGVAGPAVGGALFAVLQDPTGHCEWQRYDPASDSWSAISSHVSCSNRVGDPAGLNYSLEGVLDLVHHLDGVSSPSEVPTWFHFASSHWTTGTGGTLVTMTQTPASRNDDGNIDANETHRAHRATFLSGDVTYYFP